MQGLIELVRAAQWLPAGLALVLFVVALAAGVYRTNLLNRRRAIERAPAEQIAAIAGDEVDKLHISAQGLTETMRYELVLIALKQRGQRLQALLAFSIVLALLLSGVVALSFFRAVPSGQTSSETTPSTPDSLGTTVAAPLNVNPRERPEMLSVDELQDRLDNMTLPNPFAEPGAPPDFLDQPIGKSAGAPAAFSVETGGMVFGLGRFALVARRGKYSVDRLYLRVLATENCPLRGETTAAKAPTTVWAYAFWLSHRFNLYDIVPLAEPGQAGAWHYSAPESEEFGLRVGADPYTLYLVTLVAEARDDISAKRFSVTSPIMPVLFVNGNDGGCLKLEGWYKPEELVPSTGIRPWRGEFPDVLSYQLAIADFEESPAFLNRVLTMDKGLVTNALTRISSVSVASSGNQFLEKNKNTIASAVNAPLCDPKAARAHSWYASISSADAKAACQGSVNGKRKGLQWEAIVGGRRVVCSCDDSP